MRFRALVVGAAALAGLAIAASDARAVGTRTFELDTLDKLTGGDLHGAVIGSDGVVRAGWNLGSVPLPENAGTTAPCAVPMGDGSILVGTGPSEGGKVVRIAGDRATVFADTKENAVNAIAVAKGGTVFAATTSNKIYKLSQGKADVFATLTDVPGVYALVADRTGALFAGGAGGKVLRIDPSGNASVYLQTDDAFVVSLAVGDDGVVYAGTSGKGLLYRITAAGRASVLYDFPGEDVHAIALGRNKSVWAIVNELPASASESSETARRATGGRTPPGPATVPHAKPGKGSLWRLDAQGRPERLMHHDEFHYLSLALDDAGMPYVGTGAEGRVYAVDDAHQVSLVADTDERQIGALVLAGGTRAVVGSDPAVYHRVLSVGGPDVSWTSKPLDAGLRARFGHIHWNANGNIEVSTRSGDTQTPDTTWSAWSGAVPNGGATSSPAARFVQIRAKLRDATAALSDLTLAFQTENLRAVVTEVAAHQRGTQETHDTKDALPPSGGEPPKHDSVVHVTWKVDNPDSDELRYRVDFHREGEPRWIEATLPDEPVTRTEFEWDTAALPEGHYRVRVDASDEISNGLGDATHFALETAPVLVDNTPPVFRSLTVQARRLRAQIEDGLGPIFRVDVAVDGKLDWKPLAAADGIFDTAVESVDVDLSPLLPTAGPHTIAVRAYDAAGNFVVRDVTAP